MIAMMIAGLFAMLYIVARFEKGRRLVGRVWIYLVRPWHFMWWGWISGLWGFSYSDLCVTLETPCMTARYYWPGYYPR
jgi:hypothetical protein